VSTAEVDMWHYIKKKSLKNKNYLKKKKKKKKEKRKKKKKKKKANPLAKMGVSHPKVAKECG
jgi:hypothetical protein